MKALIVIEEGRNLFPLTATRPLSMLEFCNRPIIQYQIEALVGAGVNRIVLAGTLSENTIANIEHVRQQLSSTTLSVETVNGAGNPLYLAKDALGPMKASDKPLFVISSSMVCEFPLKRMKKFHKSHGKEGTILVKDVANRGTGYYDPDDHTIGYISKPRTRGNMFNSTGVYLFNPPILDRAKADSTCLENDIFQDEMFKGQLKAFVLEEFWLDPGKPDDLFVGSVRYLHYLRDEHPEKLAVANGDNQILVHGNVLIDPSAVIGKRCQFGPNVVLGARVTIGDGVSIKYSIVFAGTKVGSGSKIDNSIIGWCCDIGKWVRMKNGCILGEETTVVDEVDLNGANILPGTRTSANLDESDSTSPESSSSGSGSFHCHFPSLESLPGSEENVNGDEADKDVE